MTSDLHSDEESRFRLELIYDEKTRAAKQGNREGLRYLRQKINYLIDDETQPGEHHHFDAASNLTYSDDLFLIIELLDE